MTLAAAHAPAGNHLMKTLLPGAAVAGHLVVEHPAVLSRSDEDGPVALQRQNRAGPFTGIHLQIQQRNEAERFERRAVARLGQPVVSLHPLKACRVEPRHGQGCGSADTAVGGQRYAEARRLPVKALDGGDLRPAKFAQQLECRLRTHPGVGGNVPPAPAVVGPDR